MEILQPPNWPRPQGFSNGIAARGRLVFVAGQIGWDEKSRIVGADFSEQVRQALVNVWRCSPRPAANPNTSRA